MCAHCGESGCDHVVYHRMWVGSRPFSVIFANITAVFDIVINVAVLSTQVRPSVCQRVETVSSNTLGPLLLGWVWW